MKRIFFLLMLLASVTVSLPVRAAEPLATLSIADATVSESNSATRELLFPVTLSKAVTYDVSASFVTRNISAGASVDYIKQTAGQLVIKAGQKKTNVLIRVLSDTTEERDESFLVQLGAPKRCAISDSDGIGTILDDDYAGQITIGDVSITEGNSGQKIAKALVRFSQPALHNIEVRFETKDGTAKVTSADYVATSGVLVFKPGRVVLSVEVPIVGDIYSEADETCQLRILVTGLATAKSSATVTISNDDGVNNPVPPFARELSIDDAEGYELNSGQNAAVLRVFLPQNATADIPINYTTRDGSANSPQDYIARSATVVIQAGSREAYFVIPIVGDKVEEINENFEVNLTAPGGLSGDNSALVTIDDSDYNGEIVVSDASLVEGNTDQKNAGVRVSLSPSPKHEVPIRFATRSASAEAGEDFFAASGTLVFSPQVPEIMVSVSVKGDTRAENDETFYLELLTDDYVVAKNTGIVTIQNDDGTVKPASNQGKIVFQSKSNDPNDSDYSQIEIMNADGTNRKTLAFVKGERQPALSPDGSHVVWAADRNTGGGINGNIYLINADGSNERELTYDSKGNSTPQFSPDGTKIVFTARLDSSTFFGLNEIIVMNLDGSGRVQLTKSRTNTEPYDPHFSPDGKQIAFTRSRDEEVDIWVMNADGSNQRRLIGNGGFSFCFAPDGKIAFTSRRDGNMEIYVAKPDGSAPVRLTNNTTDDFVGSYSPDGTQITFSSNRAGIRQIYVMNADGTRQIQRTNAATNINPSWSVGSVFIAPPTVPAPASTTSAGNS